MIKETYLHHFLTIFILFQEGCWRLSFPHYRYFLLVKIFLSQSEEWIGLSWGKGMVFLKKTAVLIQRWRGSGGHTSMRFLYSQGSLRWSWDHRFRRLLG